MLSLTRYATPDVSDPDKSKLTFLTNDGPIELEVEYICGSQVKLSISAPDDVIVLRNELLEDGDLSK